MTISLNQLFSGLIAVPSWNVKKGHGSFVTFEFGSPSIEISPVRPIKATPEFPASQERTVAVHGEWHLWIYCCAWEVSQEGTSVSHDGSSDKAIDTACRVLDGQAIKEIQINHRTKETIFTFDLGGRLVTRPYGDEVLEQWHLYCPDGKVFTFRSDGKYSFETGECPSEEEQWAEFEDPTAA